MAKRAKLQCKIEKKTNLFTIVSLVNHAKFHWIMKMLKQFFKTEREGRGWDEQKEP